MIVVTTKCVRTGLLRVCLVWYRAGYWLWIGRQCPSTVSST